MEIIDGVLCINSASGIPVPSDWLAQNSAELLRGIAIATKASMYVYDSYSTGYYRVNDDKASNKSGGVSLCYLCLSSGEPASITFNAILTRARNTRSGAAGSRLPKKQFRVGPRYSFTKFWDGLGLARPRSPSEYHGVMGRLTPVVVEAQLKKKGRLDKISIGPANVPYSAILVALHVVVQAGISPVISWDYSGNLLVKTSDKDLAEGQGMRAFGDVLSAGSPKGELSNQGSAYKDCDGGRVKSPIAQTNDEWLADYHGDAA